MATHMHRLSGKRIILGVTGGIAAYKTAELIRILRRNGAEVRVVMTEGACKFITPLTLQALSGNPVHTSLLDSREEAAMGHIALARWADTVFIAPATADFIAQIATARGDNLLSAICLATKAPVCVAPAMNQAMWGHPGTQSNVSTLRSRNVRIFGPDQGEQACGETGYGRMLSPMALATALANTFSIKALTGKRVLITAGPTRERIDPVRFLSNRSSGKMGFALARAAVDAGANVTLITGPVSLETPEKTHRINVESAREMSKAVLDILSVTRQDVLIASAAVADYRPATVLDQKMKKTPGDEMEKTVIELVRNPDILMQVSSLKKDRPFTVGFAAETSNVLDNAKEKMAYKHLDMMVANDISDDSIGFNSDVNAVTIFSNHHPVTTLPVMSKMAIASKLMALIAESIDPKSTVYDIKKYMDPENLTLNTTK